MPEIDGSGIMESISICSAAVVETIAPADLISAVHTIGKLSEENDMARFCKNLLSVAITKIGAAKGLFFMVDHPNRAIFQSAVTVTGANSAEKTGFAESVVDFAVRKQKMVLIGDVSASSFFGHDHYIKDHQAESILCIPLVQEGRVEAIVYLEDFQVEKVSSKSQLSGLCLIMTQASVFFRNIQRYQAKAESERRYRRRYEQKSAKAQMLARHIVTAQAAHDIRASINAILVYLEILKESLHDSQPLDRRTLAGNVDQIISRSWHLLTLINRGISPDGFGNRPGGRQRKGRRLNGHSLCEDISGPKEPHTSEQSSPAGLPCGHTRPHGS